MRIGFKFQTTVATEGKIVPFYLKRVSIQALFLSNTVRRDKFVGEIVNLMPDDAYAIYLFTAQWQIFWSMPLQVRQRFFLFFLSNILDYNGYNISLLYIGSVCSCSNGYSPNCKFPLRPI